MADPKANGSSGDTGLSPVSGWWVPPDCSSGLGPTWDAGPAQDGVACRSRAPLLPCPPQHPVPCSAGAWEMFPTSATLGLGNGVPPGSRTPRGQYMFKPYPSAISLWLPSPPLGIVTSGTAAIAPTVGLVLSMHSLGCAKGVIGSIPQSLTNRPMVEGQPGSGKSFAKHLLSAPRHLGPVGCARCCDVPGAGDEPHPSPALGLWDHCRRSQGARWLLVAGSGVHTPAAGPHGRERSFWVTRLSTACKTLTPLPVLIKSNFICCGSFTGDRS